MHKIPHTWKDGSVTHQHGNFSLFLYLLLISIRSRQTGQIQNQNPTTRKLGYSLHFTVTVFLSLSQSDFRYIQTVQKRRRKLPENQPRRFPLQTARKRSSVCRFLCGRPLARDCQRRKSHLQKWPRKKDIGLES